jgi:hypothetical protein
MAITLRMRKRCVRPEGTVERRKGGVSYEVMGWEIK